MGVPRVDGDGAVDRIVAEYSTLERQTPAQICRLTLQSKLPFCAPSLLSLSIVYPRTSPRDSGSRVRVLPTRAMRLSARHHSSAAAAAAAVADVSMGQAPTPEATWLSQDLDFRPDHGHLWTYTRRDRFVDGSVLAFALVMDVCCSVRSRVLAGTGIVVDSALGLAPAVPWPCACS